MSAVTTRIARPSTVIAVLAVLAVIQIGAAGASGAMVAPDSATGAVQQLIRSIDQLRVTTDPAERAKLARSIDASLALEPLCRESLGAEWARHDAREHARFVAIVRKSLEKFAYPRAAQFFSGMKIAYLGEENSRGDTMVRTTSSVGGGAVSIDYAMKKIAGKWAVVDIILDHQSLAQSVAAQMQAVLKSGSYNDLVAQMESRLKQEG